LEIGRHGFKHHGGFYCLIKVNNSQLDTNRDFFELSLQMMMNLKKILLSVFFVASISLYMGHDFVYYCNNVTAEIENSNNSADIQRLSSSESSSEEEVSFITNNYSLHLINSGLESSSPNYSCVPLEVHLPIWLPPDNS